MKYGQQFKQRSVRAWGHYNLDYDEVKHLIKEHTSAGKGKAVSIPGQGSATEKNFESLLYNVLRDQFERVELFVRSKTGEIERRLNHLSRQIRTLRSQIPSQRPTDIPVRRLERYSRIESDILRIGQDIKSLARFTGAQRLGFYKLLKKYRKWTGSSELPDRFRSEFLDQSLSLSRHNPDSLLANWAEVLQAFRTPFEALYGRRGSLQSLSAVAKPPGAAQSSASITSHFRYATASQSEVDFDSAFATLPIGDTGSKAVYLVHPEQTVEVQVLLLQYLRLLAQQESPSTPADSQSAGPSRRSSLSLVHNGALPQQELDIDSGLCILDDDRDYARKQSSNVITEIQHPATHSKAPAGRIRWALSSDAVIVLKSAQQDLPDTPCGYNAAKVKRTRLDSFLQASQPLRSPSHASSGPADALEAAQRSAETVSRCRAWLEKHHNVAPLAFVGSKRTRFLGLDNDELRGQWAVLDQNVYLSKGDPAHLSQKDWISRFHQHGTRFPYAVLEVRQEGPLAVDLIDVLDRTYLTERVRGFGLEAQAVWVCCRPPNMAAPSWLPLLARDIRKLPNKESPPTHRSIVTFDQPSGSITPSDSGGLLSSSVGERPGSSSATTYSSGPPISERSRHKPKGRAKSTRPRVPSQPAKEPPPAGGGGGYWNEYDFPEDGDYNDAYVIYVDPNASVGFPGQEMLEKMFKWMRRPFSAKDDERRPLLSPIEPFPTMDGTEESSSDETDNLYPARRYRTIQPPPAPKLHKTHSAFSANIYRFDPRSRTRTPCRRRSRSRLNSQQHVDPFSAELERQFHEREKSKLRICITSLAASVAILVVSTVLAATGRRKQVGTVDEGILFGIVASLLFAGVGIGYLLSLSWDGRGGSDGRAGYAKKAVLRGGVVLVFVGVCAASGSLIAWMIS